MLDPPLETKGKVTPVSGRSSTVPNTFKMVCVSNAAAEYFRDEYIAHIVDKKCPAHVCKKLMQYVIEPDLCKMCSLCARKCPVNAITGEVRKTPFAIDQDKCIKCGMCISSCKFKAIVKK